MRRRNREALGVFSVSAIDLFACALGAFILISLILFPFFPNREDLRPEVERLRAALATIEATLEASLEARRELQAQVDAQDDATARAAELERKLRGAAFIGIEPTSTNFHVVLDLSGSVVDYVDPIEAAVSTIIDRLEESDTLRVSTYQGLASDPTYSYWPSATGFQDDLSEATKTSALSFVANALARAGGNTPTFEAIDLALQESVESSIILVTDGVPTSDDYRLDRREVELRIAEISSENAGAHQINIVGIGEFTLNETASAMVGLAAKNGGAFVALP